MLYTFLSALQTLISALARSTPDSTLQLLFDASDLRRVLYKDDREDGKRNSQLVNWYLHDMIHTLHCPQSEDEYMVRAAADDR